jgi:hypothetical protein
MIELNIPFANCTCEGEEAQSRAEYTESALALQYNELFSLNIH